MIPDIQINQYLFCIVQFSLNFSITRFSLSMSSLLHTREQQTECSDFTLFQILKQILSHQKVIAHRWIQWKKTLELSNFRNIFGIKDFGHKNLRFLVLFLYLPMFHALLPLTGASRWLEDSVILP